MARGAARVLASLAAVVLIGCGLGVVGSSADDSPGTPDAAPDARRDVTTASPPQEDASSGVDVDSPLVDGGVDAGPPRVLKFEQSAFGDTNDPPYKFTVKPTKAGSFVAFMVSANGTNTTVTSITDNSTTGANVYTSTGARGATPAGGCQQGTEIWYARSVKSATEFTINLSADNTIQAWFLEVSGLLPSGGPTLQVGAGGSGAVTTANPLVVDSAPALLLASVASCNFIGAKSAGNPILEIKELQGNNAGYFIADAPNTFTVTWTNLTSTGWNKSIAVFR